MVEMTVCKKYFDKIYRSAERGASVLEVLLAITVVLSISPFLYNQIIDISKDVQDIAMANKIVKNRDKIINVTNKSYEYSRQQPAARQAVFTKRLTAGSSNKRRTQWKICCNCPKRLQKRKTFE